MFQPFSFVFPRTQWLRLEGTSKYFLILPIAQTELVPNIMSRSFCSKEKTPQLLGDLCHLHNPELLPEVQREPPAFGFVPTALFCVGHCWAEPDCVLVAGTYGHGCAPTKPLSRLSSPSSLFLSLQASLLQALQHLLFAEFPQVASFLDADSLLNVTALQNSLPKCFLVFALHL